jgi:valyl-tRNA synthetase
VPLLDGRLKFIPERYTKNYQTWLENLRDWPISRQLWWGHQIPVWSKAGSHPNRCEYGTFCTVVESEQGPVTYACVKPGFEELEQAMTSEGWVRDSDVLDTWFSSALWPFSTMGWPEDNQTLKKFYPTDVLCTAREIITLWVSRMVMMGQYCVGDIPFSDVYIHAMIQDGQGRKMSKSLGNGIDPLVAIDSHGADAMRFTLASMTTDTQDVRMPVAELKLPDGRTVNSSPKFDRAQFLQQAVERVAVCDDEPGGDGPGGV